MSFLARIGARLCNQSVRVLGASGLQLSTACQYHILSQCQTLNIGAAISPAITSPALITPTSDNQRLLTPLSSLVMQVAGFKVKGRLKRRCKDCYIVVRQERSYVICPTHPRHKQMQMKKRDYKSWILTHATQSKIRPY